MYLTETEHLEKQKQNLHILEQQLANNKFSVEEISDFLPGVFHTNGLEDISIKHVNRVGQNYFGLTTREMIDLGEIHMVENYHPTTFTEIAPKIIQFGKEDDNENSIFGYTQYLRRDRNQEFEASFGFSKISKELNCFICIENQVEIFGNLSHKMTKLLDDNEFLRKNYKKFATLTKREIEIIRMIGVGKTRNEIADFLCISTNTLDTHRKNIRNKLELKATAEMFQYIRAFDLV